MNLVGYGSDSDGSGAENKPQPIKPTAKPAFQKVVDRSSHNKIKVNLPSARAEEAHEDISAPPAKRLRRGPGEGGGGLFSGLSSFLPAPKRSGPAAAPSASTIIKEETSGFTGRRLPGRGLGSGISLKTGAAPGFTREAMPACEDDGEQEPATFISNSTERFNTSDKIEAPEVKIVGQVTMFRPLSVTRKAGTKKKKTAPPNNSTTASDTGERIATSVGHLDKKPVEPMAKPIVSLFSMHNLETSTDADVNRGQGYKPLLVSRQLENVEDDAMAVDDSSIHASQSKPAAHEQPTNNAQPGQQSLQSLASDLKLSKAEQRQLFGRNARGMADLSATNVVNFNTDTEYAANEELRAKGEIVSHQPVRGIAPGKHSLRQLMNTAVTQKDALEESFAQGAKNRKEAGSKYGW